MRNDWRGRLTVISKESGWHRSAASLRDAFGSMQAFDVEILDGWASRIKMR